VSVSARSQLLKIDTLPEIGAELGAKQRNQPRVRPSAPHGFPSLPAILRRLSAIGSSLSGILKRLSAIV
jgi:hypothetical protein